MAIVRVVKNKDYTVMSNAHLHDKRLSLKAVGLLSIVLSLPDDWHYTVKGLVGSVKDGERAVNGALSELKQCGYLQVNKLYPNSERSKIEYQYVFYEKPQDIQNVPLEQDLQNVDLQNVGAYINTNKQSTNKQNTKELSTNEYKEKNIKKETVNSVIAEYTESKDLQDALHDFVDMRTKARKPLTVRAMKLSLNELDKLAVDDVTKIAIVNQSITHNWLTFYKLQNNNNGQRQLTRKEMGYAF
ncbi:hypothetical protein [Holdemanella biformis]|uniref:hypothetical protein n=1 Tax=Holdemanella biformis TaxID=1735 RepID=UPI003AB75F24